MDLTVEIHDAESLDECLNQFTDKEWLHGENMYKCDGYGCLILWFLNPKSLNHLLYCLHFFTIFVSFCTQSLFIYFLFFICHLSFKWLTRSSVLLDSFTLLTLLVILNCDEIWWRWLQLKYEFWSGLDCMEEAYASILLQPVWDVSLEELFFPWMVMGFVGFSKCFFPCILRKDRQLDGRCWIQSSSVLFFVLVILWFGIINILLKKGKNVLIG